MSDIASAGITAGGGLVGNVINAISAKRTQKRQFEYNMQLQQQQQKFETDMWNKANEYNSPQQQMARLQEAGLNPNMVYGQSSAAAAGQASVPQGAANSVGNLQPIHVDLNQVALAAAQVNTQVQTSRLLQRQQDAASAAMQKDLAEAAYKMAQTPGARATSQQLTQFAERYSEYLQLQLDERASDIHLKQSQSNFYKWSAQDLQYSIEKLKPAQREFVLQQVDESKQRIKQKWQELQIESRKAGAMELQSKAALQNANTNALVGAAQVGSLNADASYKKQQELTEFAKTEEQKLKNKFSNLGIDPNLGGIAGSFVRAAASYVMMGGVALGDDYLNP